MNEIFPSEIERQLPNNTNGKGTKRRRRRRRRRRKQQQGGEEAGEEKRRRRLNDNDGLNMMMDKNTHT